MALYLRPCIACCQFDLNAAWRQTSAMRIPNHGVQSRGLGTVSQALMLSDLGSRSQCVTQTQQQQHNAAQLQEELH